MLAVLHALPTIHLALATAVVALLAHLPLGLKKPLIQLFQGLAENFSRPFEEVPRARDDLHLLATLAVGAKRVGAISCMPTLDQAGTIANNVGLHLQTSNRSFRSASVAERGNVLREQRGDQQNVL